MPSKATAMTEVDKNSQSKKKIKQWTFLKFEINFQKHKNKWPVERSEADIK